MFKDGDKVKVRLSCSGAIGGEEYILKQIGSNTFSANGCTCETNWQLLTNTNNMNLKEKFILSITKEPNKSFRKAGITNGDDILTEDGQKVFLSWLLHNKYAEEFKKDVVDGMLEEMKEEGK